MTSAPKASFIVPFYNNGATLPETMDSIFKQTYTNFDVWIINDGSTDPSSLAVLEKYEGKPSVTIIHQANAGPSVARNQAIRQTNAEIIIPLDSDDLIRPDALSKAVEIFVRNSDIDVIYSDQQLFEGASERRVSGEVSMRRMLMYNFIPLCSFIKKEVFESCGYFDEYLSKLGLEDWELWIRALHQDKKFFYVREILFDIRVRLDSRTHTEANKNLQHLKEYIYNKHLGVLLKEYQDLFYENRWIKSSLPYKLLKILATPYRLIISQRNHPK